MIHGENVILSIDNKQVAAAKSCELDVNQNFIQVCSPVSGRWDSFVPSTIGWTASVDMLVVSMANPQAWLNEMKQSATPLTMRYYDTELGIYQVGQCWIAKWANGATVGSISTFSLQLQGTGELSEPQEEVVPIVTMGSYAHKKIATRLHVPLQYYISNDNAKTLKYKTIVALSPVRMKLVSESLTIEAMILNVNGSSLSDIVTNNRTFTDNIVIRAITEDLASYITLNPGSYSLICDSEIQSSISWKIIGHWQ